MKVFFGEKEFKRISLQIPPNYLYCLVDKFKKVITSPDLLLLEVRFTVTVSPNHQESGAMSSNEAESLNKQGVIYVLRRNRASETESKASKVEDQRNEETIKSIKTDCRGRDNRGNEPVSHTDKYNKAKGKSENNNKLNFSNQPAEKRPSTYSRNHDQEYDRDGFNCDGFDRDGFAKVERRNKERPKNPWNMAPKQNPWNMAPKQNPWSMSSTQNHHKTPTINSGRYYRDRDQPAQTNQEICWWHKMNRCKYGKYCRNPHREQPFRGRAQ